MTNITIKVEAIQPINFSVQTENHFETEINATFIAIYIRPKSNVSYTWKGNTYKEFENSCHKPTTVNK